MNITLEEVKQNLDRGKSQVVGWALVNLADKMKIWINVVNGEHGYYLRFPSQKIDGKFVPTVQWINKNMLKQISNAVLNDVKKELPRFLE